MYMYWLIIFYLNRIYWTEEARISNPNGKVDEQMAGYIADAEKLRKAFLNCLLSLKVNVSDDKEGKKDKDHKMKERERNFIAEEKEREKERERERDKESQKKVLPAPQQSIKKQKNDIVPGGKPERTNSNDNNTDGNDLFETKTGVTLNSKLNTSQSGLSSTLHTSLSSTGTSSGVATPNPAIIDRKVAKYCRDMIKDLLQQVFNNFYFTVLNVSDMYMDRITSAVIFCTVLYCIVLNCTCLCLDLNEVNETIVYWCL